MPLDQLLLHLSNNRFRTRFFDGAAHCYNETCVSDQLGCKDFRLIGGDVYPTFPHRVYDGRVDPRRGYRTCAPRVHPVLLREGLGHLASSRVLNTDTARDPLPSLDRSKNLKASPAIKPPAKGPSQ